MYSFCIICLNGTCLFLNISVPVISGGQRCVGAFAQRAGERGGQTQQSRGRERAAQTKDHRGGDLQTGAAQRAGEDQRGERTVMEMLFDSRLLQAVRKTFAFTHTKQQMIIVLLHLKKHSNKNPKNSQMYTEIT